MAAKYIPDRGDIIWINFSPQAGHEQAGKRPALIISPKLYNSNVGLVLLCPITGKIKGFPFEVQLSEKGKVKGVVLSDQIKNLDWKARQAKFIEKIPDDILDEVVQKALTLIQESK